MAAYERVTLNRGGRNSRFDCSVTAVHVYTAYLESRGIQMVIFLPLISFTSSDLVQKCAKLRLKN